MDDKPKEYGGNSLWDEGFDAGVSPGHHKPQRTHPNYIDGWNAGLAYYQAALAKAKVLEQEAKYQEKEEAPKDQGQAEEGGDEK